MNLENYFKASGLIRCFHLHEKIFSDKVRLNPKEDLVQGFGMKSEDKYSHSYETAGKLINTMTNGKASVVFDFFHRVVHAYMIGNDDMHLKNISLQKFPGA